MYIRLLLQAQRQPVEDGLPDSVDRHACGDTRRTHDIPRSLLRRHQSRLGSVADIHHSAQRFPRSVRLNARCRLRDKRAVLHASGTGCTHVDHLHARDRHRLSVRRAARVAPNGCHHRDRNMQCDRYNVCAVVRSVRCVRVQRQVAARLLRLLHGTDTHASGRFPHKHTIRMDCSAPSGTPRVHQQRHRVAPRMALVSVRRALRVPDMHHRSIPASGRSDIKQVEN